MRRLSNRPASSVERMRPVSTSARARTCLPSNRDPTTSKSTSEKVLGRLYENAMNACEASVHVEPNYVPSYVHLAVLRSMINQGADAMVFCNKGLEAVARLRGAPFHRSELPAIRNAGQDLDKIEKDLMSIKASLRQ